MEESRILAKTLIGLRNIAWAACMVDKRNQKAAFMLTILNLAVLDNGSHASGITQMIRASVNDIL